jgi:hypothetical protein
VVWGLAFDQLDDSAAQTPYVRGRGCPRELNDLWSHPVRSAHDTRLVETGLLGSDTEIGQLDQSLFRCKNIGALDVSMYDTLLVEVEQTVEDLGHVQSDEVFGELAEVFADAVQRAVLAVPVNISP